MDLQRKYRVSNTILVSSGIEAIRVPSQLYMVCTTYYSSLNTERSNYRAFITYYSSL